jgi:hypothetical protein
MSWNIKVAKNRLQNNSKFSSISKINRSKITVTPEHWGFDDIKDLKSFNSPAMMSIRDSNHSQLKKQTPYNQDWVSSRYLYLEQVVEHIDDMQVFIHSKASCQFNEICTH